VQDVIGPLPVIERPWRKGPHVDRIGSVYISRKQGQFQTAFVRLSMVLSNGVD